MKASTGLGWILLVFLPQVASACGQNYRVVETLIDRSPGFSVPETGTVVRAGLLVRTPDGRQVLYTAPISLPSGHLSLLEQARREHGEVTPVWMGELQLANGPNGVRLVAANETSGTAHAMGLTGGIGNLQAALGHGPFTEGTRFETYDPGREGFQEHLAGKLQALSEKRKAAVEATGNDPNDTNTRHQIGNVLNSVVLGLAVQGLRPSAEREQTLRVGLDFAIEYFRFMREDGYDFRQDGTDALTQLETAFARSPPNWAEITGHFRTVIRRYMAVAQEAGQAGTGLESWTLP